MPDGISHRKVSACAFATSVKTYRGTVSYQSELKQKISIDGDYKGMLLGAAFTSSAGFDLIEKSTIEQEMSLTHATAECSAY